MNLETSNTIMSIVAIIGGIITIAGLIFKKGKKEADVSERVSNLEKGFGDMGKDIKNIKENHLAHIQNDISNININLSAINTTLEFLKQK